MLAVAEWQLNRQTRQILSGSCDTQSNLVSSNHPLQSFSCAKVDPPLHSHCACELQIKFYYAMPRSYLACPRSKVDRQQLAAVGGSGSSIVLAGTPAVEISSSSSTRIWTGTGCRDQQGLAIMHPSSSHHAHTVSCTLLPCHRLR